MYKNLRYRVNFQDACHNVKKSCKDQKKNRGKQNGKKIEINVQ